MKQNSIEYFIKKLGDSHKSSYRAKHHKNQYTKECRRLKLCTKCNHVWEISVSGSILRYGDLPTIGLPRKDCVHCKK